MRLSAVICLGLACILICCRRKTVKPSETHTNYGISDIYVDASCNPDSASYHIAYACFVPNSFTPGSDGINDLFYPKTNRATNLEFRIYNHQIHWYTKHWAITYPAGMGWLAESLLLPGFTLIP